MNNFDRVEVKLFKKKLPVREFEMSRDSAEIIIEALRFYALNAERVEGKMMVSGCQRLRMAAFNLKKDLQDVLEVIYDRQ